MTQSDGRKPGNVGAERLRSQPRNKERMVFMKKITDTKIIEAAEHWYINEPAWKTIKTDNAEYIAKLYAEISQETGEQTNGYALYELRHYGENGLEIDPNETYLKEDDEPIGWLPITAELRTKKEDAEEAKKANEPEFDFFRGFFG